MSSTNRGTKRNAADFYPTPAGAFAPLMPILPRFAEYWEPACGDGRLIKWLQAEGFPAGGTDLSLGRDFFADETTREFIITNPPFTLAQEFVAHALLHSRETMMLLRLNFLGSQKRCEWWRNNEPSALFVLSSRPDFTGGGGDSCEYAWFYWGRRWQGVRHL